MQFIVFMIPGNRKTYEGGAMPEQAAIDKMMKYNEELVKAGVMVGGGGFYPNAARFAFSGGKASVTDGPYPETKELIGGYWIWQVKSREEALAWAKRCPADEGDVLELRQEFSPEDFGPENAAKERELNDLAEKIKAEKSAKKGA